MKRPSKRTLLMVLLLLTGGAIINVAVAWGCASLPVKWHTYFPDPDYSLPREIPSVMAPMDARWINEHDWHSAENQYIWWDIKSWLGVEQRLLCSYKDQSPPTKGWYAMRIRAGWPCLSLDGSFQMWSPGPQVERIDKCVGSILISVRVDSDSGKKQDYYLPRPLPLGVVWPGFAINTIFYAAIVWLLFATLGFVRRRIRARRGQCPACAYPVGSSNVCTECGKAVSHCGR